nr:hypothetical protein [uncultured Flavobacterium sp.]
MKLTGKAKEDFSYKYNMSNFNEYSEVLQNALIIEFFDSLGIYILITDFDDYDFWCEFKGLSYSILGKTRQEAIEQAIIKANEIYNERNII